jgi:Arc/MetJ family transcription regulator
MRRTNIVLDEKLVSRARRLVGARTTRELVDRALRELVEREERRRLVQRLEGSGWEGDPAALRRPRAAGHR